jgi:hypothetical protein
MNPSTDNRTQPRINFPNTSLSIKQTQPFIKIFSYNGQNEIVDLSKSGAGIISTIIMNKGEKIKLKIKFPNEKDMTLKGQVKWTNPINGNGAYRAGIQFQPFGYKRYYNSIEDLERLNKLTM